MKKAKTFNTINKNGKNKGNTIGGKWSKPQTFINDECPPICLTFGCGKMLTPMEYLFSEYCFKCAQKRKQIL